MIEHACTLQFRYLLPCFSGLEGHGQGPRPSMHSGTFDEFYCSLKFAYDNRKNSLNHAIAIKESVLLSFDEFFFDLLANMEQN